MEPEQAIHSDRHRASIFRRLSFPLVVGVAVAALLYRDPVLFFLALGLGLFAWVTTPTRYDIFRDRLVVNYGRPRRTVVSFADIMNAEVLKLAFGERLVVRRKSGRALLLSPGDLHSFQAELEKALGGFAI